MRSQEESLIQKQEETNATSLLKKRAIWPEASQVQETLRTREEYISAIENSVAWMLVGHTDGYGTKFGLMEHDLRQIYDSLKNSLQKLRGGAHPLHSQTVPIRFCLRKMTKELAFGISRRDRYPRPHRLN